MESTMTLDEIERRLREAQYYSLISPRTSATLIERLRGDIKRAMWESRAQPSTSSQGINRQRRAGTRQQV
jgi:hypothetical protein